jgi:hypothetical protein
VSTQVVIVRYNAAPQTGFHVPVLGVCPTIDFPQQGVMQFSVKVRAGLPSVCLRAWVRGGVDGRGRGRVGLAGACPSLLSVHEVGR